jgi:di/tricarboxylate transporter
MGITTEESNSLMRDIEFSNIKLLADLDRVTLAKVVSNCERVHVKSGETIYRPGDPGDALYIIIDGIVRVFAHPEGKLLEIACLGAGQWFGEMALLTGEATRTTEIEAQTDLDLLKLPREDFNQLIRKHPSLGINMASVLASKLVSTNVLTETSGQISPDRLFTTGQHSMPLRVTAPKAPVGKRLADALKESVRDRRYQSLALTAVVCALTAFFLKGTGLSTQRIILMELLIGATILWSMKAFTFHTVSIALPVMAVFLGAASPATAFSGFSSSTWFLVLAVFGLSAAISKTGLLYRITLHMIKFFPGNYLGQTLAIAISGVIMTPVIPSPNGRVALASPLVVMLSEILGFRKGSPGAIGFSMASLLGYGNMYMMFLNGSFVCFFVVGLLPPEISATITWVYWFKAALVMSIVYFIGFYLCIVILYRPKEMGELVPSLVNTQLRILGPFTAEEKFCLIAVIISLAGFLTQSWHHVDGAWIAFASLLILFGSSVLDETTIRTGIDWPFLISLGALIGFSSIISASGLPQIVAHSAGPYAQIFVKNRFFFLPVVVVCVILIRFVLPAFAALVVCILALLPLASTLDINPFVIVLVVILVNEPWFFSHQSIIYRTLMSATEERLFEPGQTVKLAFYHVLVAVIAVAVSFPYWKYIGLIK